ncbi:MAG: InlB B-repeat-containing protein [Clostridia bacterium]|nr:InlB B-repeat-containing protein [Clostridia bacterium]
MKKMNKFLLTSMVSLCAFGLFAGNAATPASATDDFPCTYSAIERGDIVAYGSSAVTTYSASEAAEKGIPEGYENEVLEITPLEGQINCGFLIDFSAEKVPFVLLDSLQFRVYIGEHASNTGGKPQVRIGVPQVGNSENEWVYQLKENGADVPTPMGEWTTVVVSESTATSATQFAKLEKDGYLGQFGLSMRTNGSVPFYVDSVQYVLKENDGVGPVITYTGEDTIALELNSEMPSLATAYDEQENCDIKVEYVWQEGVALNANGTPAEEGTYTLTMKAADYYGNVTKKTITVNVIETDRVSPVINVNFDTVKATVGTKPMLKATASDNNGTVTVNTVWSDGALDQRGRLTEGTHTWTITAKDAFNNATTKTVTFIVTEEEPAYNYIINEENITVKHTVTFDGENAVEVTDGFILAQPADPVREATAAANYRFLGWYLGEELWDFETPVTQDLALVSKWEVTQRVYRVTFDGANMIKLPYGSVIPEEDVPANPKKTSDAKYDYVFEGWYFGEHKWDFATDTVQEETALVAKFTSVDRTFTVTFDGKDAQAVKYGELIVKPEDPVKEGYTFLGWYYSSKKWNFLTDKVTMNIALTAKWQQNAANDGNSSDTASDEEEKPGDNEGSGLQKLLGGCGGVVGGVAGGIVAMGIAAVALLKKKED